MATKLINTKDAGKILLRDEHGSGWMIENPDWHQWWRRKRHKEHRRARQYQLGYNTVAMNLIKGASISEARSAGGAVKNAVKSAQKKKKKGLIKLAAKTSTFMKQHGGKMMVGVGLVATVIPVVGWIVGPAMQAGGAVLTKAQAARMAGRIARRRQYDLLAAKKKYEEGEINAGEYKKIGEGIIAEEGTKIKAEDRAAAVAAKARAEAAKPVPMLIKPKEVTEAVRRKRRIEEELIKMRKKEKEFPTTALAVGGSVAAVAAIGLVAIVVLKRKRRTSHGVYS